MRTVRGVSCVHRGLSVVGLAFLAASALAAEKPGTGNGTYASEAVVRSLGGHRVVVALDEAGSGIATRLFYVETRGPVEALALRSPGARVESSENGLAVFLPRENRRLVFAFAAGSHRPGALDPAAEAASPEGFALTRIARVVSLTEYAGDGRSLDALEAVDSGAGGTLQSLGSSVFNFPPDTGDGDGGGCSSSCKTLCPIGQCNLNCSSGCAVCGCSADGTPNCHC